MHLDTKLGGTCSYDETIASEDEKFASRPWYYALAECTL